MTMDKSLDVETVQQRQCHTGFEMTRMFAFGAESAAALAKSRTMDALVLNKSAPISGSVTHLLSSIKVFLPSRVMPGLRGTPAGMRTISALERASLRPEGVGS